MRGVIRSVRGHGYGPRSLARRPAIIAAVFTLVTGGSVIVASSLPTHASATPSLAHDVSVAAPAVPAPRVVPSTATSTSTSTTVAVPASRPAPSVGPINTDTVSGHKVTVASVPPKPPVTAPAVTKRAIAAATGTAAAGGCSAALTYLRAHSAPGFRFECPGYALGHQAMTCIDVAGVCPGTKLITIADACPAAYMNEAHNSWVLSGAATGPIDPYGYCH